MRERRESKRESESENAAREGIKNEPAYLSLAVAAARSESQLEVSYSKQNGRT